MSNRPGAATWEIMDDPRAFLDVAGDALAADPVQATIVATTAHRRAARLEGGDDAPGRPHWYAVARGPDGSVVGIAMRTAPKPPHQAYVMEMEPVLAAGLADLLHARGEVAPAVTGALAPARAFLDRVAQHAGGTVQVRRPTRLFELGALTPPARLPPGGARLATDAEVDLVHGWFGGFLADADQQAGRTPSADEAASLTLSRDVAQGRIERGTIWLWEDDGEPVSMVGVRGPALGVARLGPVYTPAGRRGRGYAGALVAHVSRVLLDAGHRVCLFTDLENPVSNALYERLGYRAVVDMAELRLEPVSG